MKWAKVKGKKGKSRFRDRIQLGMDGEISITRGGEYVAWLEPYGLAIRVSHSQITFRVHRLVTLSSSPHAQVCTSSMEYGGPTSRGVL